MPGAAVCTSFAGYAGTPVFETVKWGHPCYMQDARNITLLGAFRDDFRMTFMNAALLTDPAGVLERRGPNTRHPDMIRFTDTKRTRFWKWKRPFAPTCWRQRAMRTLEHAP